MDLQQNIYRVLFICAVIPFLSAASTYYVADNGNDNNVGSDSAPFKNISAAVSKVEAGDSIVVASGTYSCTNTISLNKNGTSEKNIFLVSRTSSRPILDFSSMSVADANYGLKLSGSYWFIKGIIIKGAGDNGLLIQGGCNNHIEYCEFLENRDSGCQLKGGAANNRIVNCDSHDNRDPDEGDADGFSPKMDVGSGNSFVGCRAWQNSDDGWDGYLRGADNVSTKLENCWCFKNGYRKDGTVSTGNGNGFKMGGSDDKTLKHNFTLIRCLAFQNRVKGFDQNNNRGSMSLYNCTAFSNQTNYAIDGGSSTLIVKNCIASGSGSNALKGGTQSSNNMNVATTNFISIDPASAFGPRNTDGSLPEIAFMHLAKNSNLIGAGEVIDNIPYSGSKPDLGCFETDVATSVSRSSVNEDFVSKKVQKKEVVYFKINMKKDDYTLITLNGRKGMHNFITVLPASGVYIPVERKMRCTSIDKW